jgi:hypothetical protein
VCYVCESGSVVCYVCESGSGCATCARVSVVCYVCERGMWCAMCARDLFLRDLLVAMNAWHNLKQFNQNTLEYLKEKILVNKSEDGLSIISKFFLVKSSFSNAGWNWSWHILTNGLIFPHPCKFLKFHKEIYKLQARLEELQPVYAKWIFLIYIKFKEVFQKIMSFRSGKIQRLSSFHSQHNF